MPFFKTEDIRGVLKNTFQIEDNISWRSPESSNKLFSNRRYSFVTPWVRQIPNAWKNNFRIKNIPKIIPMLMGLFLCNIFYLNFLSHCHVLCFLQGKYAPKINRTLTPGPGWPPEEGSAKVPPEVGPGQRYFCTHSPLRGVTRVRASMFFWF